MGHIIMETVKNKRFNYTTSPIAKYPYAKTVQNGKNVSVILPQKRKTVNSTDKNVVKQAGKERQLSIGVNLMGTAVRFTYLIRESENIRECRFQ